MSKTNKRYFDGKLKKHITIHIPAIYEENIEFLVQKEIVESRSHAVRVAIDEFLEKELDINKKLLNREGIK